MIKKKRKSSHIKKLNLDEFHVTIFGSARINKGHPEYNEIFNLAKEIGREGMNLVTGGGPGIMEAASAGHKAGRKKNTSHTIGLNIKLPHEQRINPYVDIKLEFTRFSERLDNFILLSNAVVVAHGGIGTMLELFFTWQLMQVKRKRNIPIILLGKQWKGLLKWLRKEPLKRKFFDKADLDLLFYAKNTKQAMKIIKNCYYSYERGNKESCADYKHSLKNFPSK